MYLWTIFSFLVCSAGLILLDLTALKLGILEDDTVYQLEYGANAQSSVVFVFSFTMIGFSMFTFSTIYFVLRKI